MESLKKWNKRSEKIWFIISILSSLAAIVISIIDNFKDVKVYYLLAIMAWGIYLIRRGLSKRLDH
tara:strand:- start:271 stop:465 length:195 start_codon:yes stop_codon:yes gene_type:complete